MAGGAAALGLIVAAAIAGAASSTGKAEAKPGPTVTATSVSTVTATTTAHPTATATITVVGRPVQLVATRTHTRTVIYTPPPKPAVNDGTYEVGVDIKPGVYRTSGRSEDDLGIGCSWERESNLSGSLDAIIANDDIDGPSIIQVHRGEYLKLSGGCNWRRA